jgi:uncharacterized protein YdaU (DUF1376 family)
MTDWYKRDPSDALEGMRCLTPEERGVYNTILDLIYERDGNLPDDDRIIAGWAGCAVQRFRRIKNRLIELGKVIVRDGRLTNPRADKELSAFEEHRKRSSRGGKVSAENRNKNNETQASTLQPLKTQNEKKKESKNIEESESAKVLSIASAGPQESKEGWGYSNSDGTVSFTAKEISDLGLKYYTLTNVYGFIRSLSESEWMETMRPLDRKRAVINKIRKTHASRTRNFADSPTERAEADASSANRQHEESMEALRERRRLIGGGRGS